MIDIGTANHRPYKNQQVGNLDPQTKLIPESDVYRLVMRSKLDSADRFQDWIVEEVIPSIRKTGAYQLQPAFTIPQTLPEALRLAADLAEQKAAAQQKRQAIDL